MYSYIYSTHIVRTDFPTKPFGLMLMSKVRNLLLSFMFRIATGFETNIVMLLPCECFSFRTDKYANINNKISLHFLQLHEKISLALILPGRGLWEVKNIYMYKVGLWASIMIVTESVREQQNTLWRLQFKKHSHT